MPHSEKLRIDDEETSRQNSGKILKAAEGREVQEALARKDFAKEYRAVKAEMMELEKDYLLAVEEGKDVDPNDRDKKEAYIKVGRKFNEMREELAEKEEEMRKEGESRGYDMSDTIFNLVVVN